MFGLVGYGVIEGDNIVDGFYFYFGVGDVFVGQQVGFDFGGDLVVGYWFGGVMGVGMGYCCCVGVFGWGFGYD